MAALQDLYAKVKDLLSREEFEGSVQAEIEVWGGLLTEAAAALLVVDSLGRNEVTFGQIADLYEGGEALLEVEVEQVGPVRKFPRRDGGEGRVATLTISDASGKGRLVLSNEEVDLVTSGTIREGGRIKVVDGLVRRVRRGLEVTTGKWGVVLVERPQDAFQAPRSQFRF